ncbi:MAG: tetratricopeptide repeat protein [Syntrophales bacterium]|nr:tetratricopeptide repeat protein [Syntrophales bacterium]
MLRWKPWLFLLLLLTMAGCLGAPMAPMVETQPPPPPPPPSVRQPDQIILEEALRGRAMSDADAVELSDRLLAAGNPALDNPKTMARLEILLLKALKSPDKRQRPALLRNLGIIHYHQGKYKKARQELQHSNELNPRDARTHFYMALLFTHQGEIYQKQGKMKLARHQFNRAAIEIEQSRKLAPNNPTYRQKLKQIIRQEQ